MKINFSIFFIITLLIVISWSYFLNKLLNMLEKKHSEFYKATFKIPPDFKGWFINIGGYNYFKCYKFIFSKDDFGDPEVKRLKIIHRMIVFVSILLSWGLFFIVFLKRF